MYMVSQKFTVAQIHSTICSDQSTASDVKAQSTMYQFTVAQIHSSDVKARTASDVKAQSAVSHLSIHSTDGKAQLAMS